MPEKSPVLIEDWLGILRANLYQLEPTLHDVFETYAAEAKFGRAFIDADIRKLQAGASILEVGAGSMILSCQLAREGYDITALEPIGDGFSHFSKLRTFVLEQARKMGYVPKILLHSAEELVDENRYEFAFSINVMEHVKNVESVIERISESLRPKGVYHFTCPNYLFPYEPHFNIPTFLNKQLTEFFLRRFIHNIRNMPDPEGTWESLNWITVSQLMKIARHHPRLSMHFDTSMFGETLLRATTDNVFASRRSLWMRLLINVIVFIKLHKIVVYLPAYVQPVIDCNIVKLDKPIK